MGINHFDLTIQKGGAHNKKVKWPNQTKKRAGGKIPGET